MALRQILNLDNFRCLLVLVFVSFLASCAGGDGGSAGGTGSAVVSWVAPTIREDNTVLSLSEIKGYRIYYGVETGNYLDKVEVSDFTATELQLTGLPSGTYYVVMTAIDTDGVESGYSPEVVVTI